MQRMSTFYLIFIILLLNIISSPITSSAFNYNLHDKLGGIRYRVYSVLVIKASEIPDIIGARADSLLAKIYDGEKWINLQLYLWNGVSKAYFSGTSLDLPRSSKTITQDVEIIIKIPKYIENMYTEEWPVEVAIKRIHHRLLIEYMDGATIGSFYLFYDYNCSGYTYKYINMYMYDNLRSLAGGNIRILDIKHEFIRSFIIDPKSYRIIDYNISYQEYLQRYTTNMEEPPWYIDDKEECGDPPHPLPPRPEEYFYIHIADNFRLTNTTEFSIYVGSCLYDGKLYIDVENKDDRIIGIFSLTIKKMMRKVEEIHGRIYISYIPINSRTFLLALDYGSKDSFEIPLSDYGLVSYDDVNYYCYNITLRPLQGDLRVNTIYLTIAKDLTGGEDDGPTPESKTVKHGWELVEQSCSTGFTKPVGKKLGNEVVLFTTPIIHGFYKPANASLDSNYGLRLVFKYQISSPTQLIFKLNGVEVYTYHIHPAKSPLTQTIWIPISIIKDIVSSATYSGIGLTVSVKSDIFDQEDAYIKFLEASISLPIHPVLWKPRSESFIFGYYTMTGSKLYTYDTLSSRLVGLTTISFSGEEYSHYMGFDAEFSYRLDILANATQLHNTSIVDMDYYISGLEVTIMFSKNYFYTGLNGPSDIIYVNGYQWCDKVIECYVRNSHSKCIKMFVKCYKDGRPWTIGEVYRAIEELKWIYDLYRSIMSLKELFSLIGDFVSNFIFFTVGKWVEALEDTEAIIEKVSFETSDYMGYNITWASNGELIKNGKFMFLDTVARRFKLTKSADIVPMVSSDGLIVIIVKVYIHSSNAQTSCSAIRLEIPIKHGRPRESPEPYTLVIKRMPKQ